MLFRSEPGTDFEALAVGYVAITALHVDMEHPDSATLLAGLDGLLG